MGHKVSPVGMRVGVIRDWESRWYAEKEYGSLLLEDVKIREYLTTELKGAGVSKIEIERTSKEVNIIIRTAKPGQVIGTNGDNQTRILKELKKISKSETVNVRVLEIKNPELDATLVAQRIAEQLEGRASFRSVQKKAIQSSMRAGAKGIKTIVSGRLGGADIARSEGYNEGVVPLHTLRADIDYALAEANTTYGRLGIKVWICRGEVLRGQMAQEPEAPKMPNRDNRRKPNNRGERRFNKTNAPEAAAKEVTTEAAEAVKEGE